MKFFTLIFSFYLLGLSLVPCEEKDEYHQKSLIATIYPDKQQEKHCFDAENCTPFCTCSHCATSAFFQPTPCYGVKKIGFSFMNYAVYKNLFSSQDFNSIWQPPQLS